VLLHEGSQLPQVGAGAEAGEHLGGLGEQRLDLVGSSVLGKPTSEINLSAG
jgi:hypothetical protein